MGNLAKSECGACFNTVVLQTKSEYSFLLLSFCDLFWTPRSGKLKIGSLRSLVLDEFDALLEYRPHRDPTRAIMQCVKRRHGDSLQSILCSATASDIEDSAKVRDFLRPGYAHAMTDPDDLLVTGVQEGKGAATHATRARVSRTVMHGAIHVPHKRLALDTVRKILHTEPTLQQILIFADTSRKVDIVVEKLGAMGIIAAPLHGGKGSDKMDRAEVSRALREGYVGIVVATELAARGLDDSPSGGRLVGNASGQECAEQFLLLRGKRGSAGANGDWLFHFG